MTSGGGHSGGAVVLGGTGWLGRHVCERLVDHGLDVAAVARHGATHVTGYDFVPLDAATATAAELTEIIAARRANVVINAIDSANATDGWTNSPDRLERINVKFVEILIDALAKLPWRPRLLHVGTIHEYGPVPDGQTIGEHTKTAPIHPYARTRLAGSRAVLDATRDSIVDGVVLRLVNICGPYPSPASFPGKLLALLRGAERAGEKAELTIAADRRDFVDVRDAADALLQAATAPVIGRSFNIGRGEAVAVRDLVRMLAEVSGVPVTELDGAPAGMGGSWICVDNEPARRLLGWAPRTRLEDSLRDMWRTQ